MRQRLAEAAIHAAPARYEPLGLGHSRSRRRRLRAGAGRHRLVARDLGRCGDLPAGRRCGPLAGRSLAPDRRSRRMPAAELGGTDARPAFHPRPHRALLSRAIARSPARRPTGRSPDGEARPVLPFAALRLEPRQCAFSPRRGERVRGRRHRGPRLRAGRWLECAQFGRRSRAVRSCRMARRLSGSEGDHLRSGDTRPRPGDRQDRCRAGPRVRGADPGLRPGADLW